MDRELLNKCREQWQKDDQAYAEEMAAISMAAGQHAATSRARVLRHPMVQEILSMFEENPLLIQPTLFRLQEQKAKIAEATLRTLYTPEQFEALRQRAIELEKSGAT